MSKVTLRPAVLGAGLVGAALLGLMFYNLIGPAKGGRKADKAAVPVVVVAAQHQDFPITLTGVGTIQAFNTVDVRAQVTGTIQKIAFTEGGMVHAGDLLAQVDPRPYQAALAQAEANLVRDQANVANAQRDLKRYDALAEKGFASAQQLETQRATVAQGAAVVKADEAAISSAKTNLGYTSIVAPIDGITGIRNIDVGNIIQPGDTRPIVSLTQVEPIAAIFTLPSLNIAAVQAQMLKGTLAAAAYDQDDKTLIEQGQLAVMDNQVDTKTGTVRLKAVFPNKDHKLWPGAFVNIHLTLETRHDGVVIPTRAVEHGTDGVFVYVVNKGVAEARRVTVLDIRGEEAFISDGIKVGDQVVVDGQLRLTPGAAVKIVPGQPPREAPDA